MNFIEFRIIKAEEVAEFRRLRLEALEHHPFAFKTSYADEAKRTIAWFSKRLGSPKDAEFAVGAFDGSQLIGIMGFYRDHREKVMHKGVVRSMYVSPAYRRQGVGRKLLEVLIEQIRALGGVEQIMLSVISGNAEASRLYESLGFRRYGREPKALRMRAQYFDEDYWTLDLGSLWIPGSYPSTPLMSDSRSASPPRFLML